MSRVLTREPPCSEHGRLLISKRRSAPRPTMRVPVCRSPQSALEKSQYVQMIKPEPSKPRHSIVGVINGHRGAHSSSPFFDLTIFHSLDCCSRPPAPFSVSLDRVLFMPYLFGRLHVLICYDVGDVFWDQ